MSFQPSAALLSLLLCFVACSNPSPTPATHPTDTPKTNLRSDTPAKTATVATKPPATESYEDPEPSLEEIMAHYMKTCRDTVKVDTTVPVNGQPWHITLRHYSTGDSAIQLAERYTSIYGLKKFITSNFESKLKVTVRDVIPIDTTIRKNIFRDSAFESLAAYGVLFYHNGIHYFRDHITVSYSYTIPLTDVGRSVSTDFY